jgi:hypothetical protein
MNIFVCKLNCLHCVSTDISLALGLLPISSKMQKTEWNEMPCESCFDNSECFHRKQTGVAPSVECPPVGSIVIADIQFSSHDVDALKANTSTDLLQSKSIILLSVSSNFAMCGALSNVKRISEVISHLHHS